MQKNKEICIVCGINECSDKLDFPSCLQCGESQMLIT